MTVRCRRRVATTARQVHSRFIEQFVDVIWLEESFVLQNQTRCFRIKQLAITVYFYVSFNFSTTTDFFFLNLIEAARLAMLISGDGLLLTLLVMDQSLPPNNYKKKNIYIYHIILIVFLSILYYIHFFKLKKITNLFY